MEKINKRFGKIKIYGKEIDLDNTPMEDLIKIYELLKKREEILEEKYRSLYARSYKSN